MDKEGDAVYEHSIYIVDTPLTLEPVHVLTCIYDHLQSYNYITCIFNLSKLKNIHGVTSLFYIYIYIYIYS